MTAMGVRHDIGTVLVGKGLLTKEQVRELENDIARRTGRPPGQRRGPDRPARKPKVRRRGDTAEVRTQVHTDGTVWVDVDKVKGNRCQEIVADLAGAIGGQVSSMTKKDAYFQLPGEPTEVKVKV